MKKEKFDILHLTISPCDHERRIFNEAFTARNKGYKVKILALKTPELPFEEDLKGIPLMRLFIKNWHGGPLKFITFNWKLWLYIRKLNFRILHVHDVWVLPAAVMANLKGNYKLVYDAHEYIRGLEIFTQKRLSGFIWKFTESVLIRKIHFLITINEHHQTLFLKNYPDIPHSIAIRNYPHFAPINSTKRNPDFTQREGVIIFQGILKRGRGLLQAIEAMKRVESGRLRIIGYGELESELHKWVQEMGVATRISFFGKIQLDKLLNETQKARGGLVLFEPLTQNYAYASPNKYFEYVMAGTPLIASNIDTFKVLNDEFEVAILVDPYNPEHIADAMHLLLTNRKLWDRLHDNCMQARKKWNWKVQENQLIDVYEMLLIP